jgi:hypothetical protein
MDAESQKYLDKSRRHASQLRAAGNVKEASHVEACIAKAEERGGLTRWEREHLPVLDIVGQVMGDLVKDLRQELRHALAELNSRCSTIEAAIPKDQPVEIATLLEAPLKEHLSTEVAAAVAVALEKDES